jgi:putative transcription factor
MQCELCGRECDCRAAIVDGVKMMVCPGCVRHGELIKVTPPSKPQKPIIDRIKRPPVKDVYKDMDKELVKDWNTKIKNARKKKGLTREQLGFKIGERTVTIAKIENGDLKPSDKIVTKLEKELDIKLLEAVERISSNLSTSSSKGLTLGDFIKTEEK